MGHSGNRSTSNQAESAGAPPVTNTGVFEDKAGITVTLSEVDPAVLASSAIGDSVSIIKTPHGTQAHSRLGLLGYLSVQDAQRVEKLKLTQGYVSKIEASSRKLLIRLEN